MSEFKQKYGPWALVTGASSGIGMEFAEQLAGKGLNLVLLARREDRLTTLAAKLNNDYSIETKVVPVDLARDDFLTDLENATSSLEIGLLVNNAGLLNVGPLVENELENELRLLHVNCRASLILAHEFGRKMQQRKKGGLIFLSSTVAFAAVSGWANYCASKSYNLMLAESLAVEFKRYNIDVLALCPGFTRTEIQELPKITNMLAMDVKPVVESALEKLGKTRLAVPGLFNKFACFSTRIQPRALNTFVYEQVIKPVQKINLL